VKPFKTRPKHLSLEAFIGMQRCPVWRGFTANPYLTTTLVIRLISFWLLLHQNVETTKALILKHLCKM